MEPGLLCIAPLPVVGMVPGTLQRIDKFAKWMNGRMDGGRKKKSEGKRERPFEWT